MAKPKPYPELGEVFELTLDGSDPAVQPLAMVKNFGYNPKDWSHDGPIVPAGPQTKKFKLIQQGGDWNDIGKTTGDEVEGQWITAFKAEYPEPDGKGPVGVHDKSWVDPFGRADFPFVFSDCDSGFRWAGRCFAGIWRWLVPVK